MSPSVQTVVLCAEEDDLDLVGLVHRARQQGVELEVVSGVDASDDPMLFAMQRVNPGLFVLMRTDNLDASRTGQLKARFVDVRVSDQHWLALDFDPDRVEAMLDGIRQRMQRIDDASDELAVGESLDRLFTPLAERSDLTSLDPDATERHKLAQSGEEETTRSIQYYPTQDRAPQARHPRARWVAAATATTVLVAAGWLGWRALSSTQSPAVEHTTADEPEAEAPFSASGVQVPTVQESPPAPRPSDDPKPQLRRRTIRRSGN